MFFRADRSAGLPVEQMHHADEHLAHFIGGFEPAIKSIGKHALVNERLADSGDESFAIELSMSLGVFVDDVQNQAFQLIHAVPGIYRQVGDSDA